MSESKYGKYVVTDLIIPEEKKKIAADYAKYATRILWLDEIRIRVKSAVDCCCFLRL
jgi:hypothetical protein